MPWSQVSKELSMSKTTHVFSKVMVCAMTFALGILSAYATEPSVREHVVEITGFTFVPETIDVNPGDTITWVNRDLVPHTATSKDGSWDTGTLNQDESKSLVVSQKMTSAYHCRFHANMAGSIAIESP